MSDYTETEKQALRMADKLDATDDIQFEDEISDVLRKLVAEKRAEKDRP